jgi:hypothetical protein
MVDVRGLKVRESDGVQGILIFTSRIEHKI